MATNRACGQLHEIVPVPRLLFAAGPILFDVVENWRSLMVFALLIAVLLFREFFIAAFIRAPESAIWSYNGDLLWLVLLLLCFQGLLLLVELFDGFYRFVVGLIIRVVSNTVLGSLNRL